MLHIWNPIEEEEFAIEAELATIADQKMAISGLTKLSAMKKKETDLGLWKQKDFFSKSCISHHRYAILLPINVALLMQSHAATYTFEHENNTRRKQHAQC